MRARHFLIPAFVASLVVPSTGADAPSPSAAAGKALQVELPVTPVRMGDYDVGAELAQAAAR